MSCGKEPFLTFGLADRVAKLSRGRHDKAKLHPYRCRECGNFHIGSSIGKRITRGGYFRVMDPEAA